MIDDGVGGSLNKHRREPNGVGDGVVSQEIPPMEPTSVPTNGDVPMEDVVQLAPAGPLNLDDNLGRQIANELFGERFPVVEQYVELLRSVGVERGLIGPRELDRIWSRHILNSVAGFRLFPERAQVADVGSGAGLPGIPLAIIRPDLSFTLIESMLRRTTFLSEVVTALRIESQVTVLRGRAEEVPGSYDVVTARAVAPLTKLIGWTVPLFAPDGELLALKGDTAGEEVTSASSYLAKAKLCAEVLTVRADPRAEATHIVRVRARTNSK